MSTKLSLAGIEINAVMHCNLACAGCSHASPIATHQVANLAEVSRDLAALDTAADVDEVRVVGGEPLLHPDLAGLLKTIRASGVGRTIRVITNGTRLHRAGWEWFDHVDEVYVSVYPGTSIDQEALRELVERGRASGKKVGINKFAYFRPVIPLTRLTAEETAAVFETCQVAHAWSCHTVQRGFVYLCPMTVDLPSVQSGESLSRCSLAPVETLAERLSAFLGRSDPLPACASCLGSVGQLVPHRQTNRLTWLSLSKSSIDWTQVEAIRSNPWTDHGCVADENW